LYPKHPFAIVNCTFHTTNVKSNPFTNLLGATYFQKQNVCKEQTNIKQKSVPYLDTLLRLEI
jgi:hypothetical protein